MGNITYCIIDEADPLEEFECEGEVIRTFFLTSPVFHFKHSQGLIQSKTDIESRLKRNPQKFFNILHFAAHGTYSKKTKWKLDYSVISQKRNRRVKEIFRPDTIVRAELQADVFLSTCCQTFNKSFIEIINGYGEINNFIAPKNSPIIGDTIIFSLMFYNELIRRISLRQKEIKDHAIIDAFLMANKAYKIYEGEGNFNLYNYSENMIYG